MIKLINTLLRRRSYRCYDCKHETRKPMLYRTELYICPECGGLVGWFYDNKKI